MLPAEGDELGLGQFHRGPHDHHRHDFLAEPLIGNADDGRLGHRRVGVQHARSRPFRVHVIPAANDELLLAADDEAEPVLVEAAQVTPCATSHR